MSRRAKPTDAVYQRTDVSPEQFFQALARLRKEARDEIDRLLTFLDQTEPDADLEEDDPPQESEPSGIGDLDGLLEQTGTDAFRMPYGRVVG